MKKNKESQKSQLERQLFISERQRFLDVYDNFNEWLRYLQFKQGDGGTELDCNYWHEIDTIYGVEHYMNNALNISLRFMRERNKHIFYIICGPFIRSYPLTIDEMKIEVMKDVRSIKDEKLKELSKILV